MTELTPYQKEAIGRATYMRQDIASFRNTWPALNSAEALPLITWSELERQLMSLSATARGSNPRSAASPRWPRTTPAGSWRG